MMADRELARAGDGSAKGTKANDRSSPAHRRAPLSWENAISALSGFRCRDHRSSIADCHGRRARPPRPPAPRREAGRPHPDRSRAARISAHAPGSGLSRVKPRAELGVTIEAKIALRRTFPSSQFSTCSRLYRWQGARRLKRWTDASQSRRRPRRARCRLS